MNKKIILLILDGWGHREEEKNNAVIASGAPNYFNLLNTCPKTFISASEESVGLPAGQMGNSEVGHTNIGAGRIVYQDFLKINKSVESGDIENNENIINFFKEVNNGNGRLHLFGLVSDGGVHSHINHIKGLAKFAKNSGIKEIYLHAFMDGRDTPPKSGIDHIINIESFLNENGCGAVASVSGRYYAMDRDKRWDRVELAYRALRHGEGLKADSAQKAVTQAYANNETDEFIRPTVINDIDGKVKDGDSIFFFNFRADRAREMCHVFTDKEFSEFDRGGNPDIKLMTMTQYEEAFDLPVAFPPETLKNIFGEIVSKKGLKQLRIAETEKYAHVTYFFNGGEEMVFDGEERALIPSPKEVATYDMKPEMSVCEVETKFEEIFKKGDIDVVVMNFANPDMVGHTGIEEAAVAACKAVDKKLGKVVKIAEETDSILLVTADHGNCEQMWDYENNQPHTAHTLNPVPFIIYNYDCELEQTGGKLADIAPTMLEIMGIDIPEEMTGQSLLR